MTASTADLTLFDDLAAEAQLMADHAANVLTLVDRLRPTMPVADVPTDGSVDVRWVVEHGRWSDWHHITGRTHATSPTHRFFAAPDTITGEIALQRHGRVQVRPHVVDDDVFVQDGVRS